MAPVFFANDVIGSNHNVFVTVAAAAAMKTAMTLSTFSTASLEEVSEAGAGSVRFLQLYVYRSRDVARRLVDRAERAGYSAIFLTVDAPIIGKRRAHLFYNPFIVPPHLQSAF